MRVVFRSYESKKYPLANICEYRYFSSRISIKKLTLLENFVAKNYENIQNYEKECRFQVSHWLAVLCRTYAQFSCAWPCTCVFYGVVLGARLPKMSRATAHTISTVVVPMEPAGAV